METETLTYDFGTTPEEVIREALTETFMDETADEEPIMWRKALSSNDLLTILDDLTFSANRKRVSANDYERSERSRSTRISTLAALGIKEG